MNTPSTSATPVPSPIKAGWRGNINGHIEGTDSEVVASQITLRLDRETAWALANVLTDGELAKTWSIEDGQRVKLSNLGAALGRLIDNGAANNGGRQILK